MMFGVAWRVARGGRYPANVRSAKDVIWGQGEGRIADVLAEVKKLDIQNPYFGIEWERNPNEPLDTPFFPRVLR